MKKKKGQGKEKTERSKGTNAVIKDDHYSADSIGDYLKVVAKVPLLSMLEEKELFIRIESGDEQAKEHVTLANRKLVVSIAMNYSGRHLTLSDLIQEGNIGLIAAVDKFDYRRGFKFSTYATWWIRQHITRALVEQDPTIRLPEHLVNSLRTLAKTSQEWSYENSGAEPTPEIIAELMGISVEQVLEFMRYAENSNGLVSLDEPSIDGKSTRYDFLENHAPDNPEKDGLEAISAELVDEFLHTVLCPRDVTIIRKRFGFDGEKQSLQEIGKDLNLTRERIRQIEARALRKLRAKIRDPNIQKKFGIFLTD